MTIALRPETTTGAAVATAVALAGEVEALVSSMAVEELAPKEAGALVEAFSRLANLAELGRARCARRAAEGLVHLREGFRTPAAWLADKAGGRVGEAIGALSVAEAAAANPTLDEALASGEVSVRKAAVVAEALGEDPAGAAELVEAARGTDLRGLKARVEARRAARSSEADVAARHEALRRRRYLRTWTGADGACRGEFSLAPSDAAPLLARLEVLRDEIFEEARRTGGREPYEAYAADALCALGASVAGDSAAGAERERGPRARVLLRVDLPALLRGTRAGDEVCEMAGVGPVPLGHAKELLSDAVVDLVIRNGVEVRSVTSLGRTIRRAVRVALTDRDPTCVVPGCGATQRLEIDHWRVDFARGGPTELENLARLCRFHHRMKTYRGWRLLGGPGAWRWVGPGGGDRSGDGAPAHAAGGGPSSRVEGADRQAGFPTIGSAGPGPVTVGDARARSRSPARPV